MSKHHCESCGSENVTLLHGCNWDYDSLKCSDCEHWTELNTTSHPEEFADEETSNG